MAHLITGYAGYEHIKSADQGSFNAAFFGDGQYVMEIGSQLGASIIDNNTVRVYSGDGLMFGRHFRIDTGSHEDVTITTGAAGTNRIDLICMTYKKNETNGTEQVYLEVIKGTPAASPKEPTYTTGNILEGAVFNQMPLYRVNISGVALTGVTQLFEKIPTYKQLAEEYANEFRRAAENAIEQFADEVNAYKNAGTYTGNGSATERRITIGKGVNAVFINGFKYMAIVSGYGAIYKKNTETTVHGLTWNEVMLSDGVLIIKTNSEVLNSNTNVYQYQAL